MIKLIIYIINNNRWFFLLNIFFCILLRYQLEDVMPTIYFIFLGNIIIYNGLGIIDFGYIFKKIRQKIIISKFEKNDEKNIQMTQIELNQLFADTGF